MNLDVKEEMSTGSIKSVISEYGVEGSARVEGYPLGVSPKVEYIHVGKDPVRYKKCKSLGSSETESEEVIEEINDVKSRWRFWPLAALLTTFSIAISPIVAGIGALVTIFVHQRDKVRKTVLLFYDFEEETKRQYKEVCDSFEFAAGADEILSGEVEFSTPDCVKTNIPTPSISTGDRSLYLLPDLVLVEEENSISKFSYEEGIKIITYETTLKSENHPLDARYKNTEWEHSNKDGSKDKRYSENKKLYNTIYEVVTIKTIEDGGERLRVKISKSKSSGRIEYSFGNLPLDSKYVRENINKKEPIEKDVESVIEAFKNYGNEKQKRIVKRVYGDNKTEGEILEDVRKKQNNGNLEISDYVKKVDNSENEEKENEVEKRIKEKYDLEKARTLEDIIEILRKMDKKEIEKLKEYSSMDDKIEDVEHMIEDEKSTKSIIEELSKTGEKEENKSSSYPVPYEKASLDVEDQKSVHEVSTHQTAEWVKKVVLEESPVHKEVAARRVADAAGVSRMGSRIQDTLEEAIQHAVQKGWVREKRHLLFDPDQEDTPIRDRGDLEGKVRDIEYVPGPEIAEAVEQVAGSSSSIGEDELIQKVAQQLGFARTGSKIKERVGSIIDTMVEEEMLASENGHLVVRE